MSYNLQPPPNQPVDREKMKAYLWSWAYTLLGLGFLFLGIAMILTNRGFLAMVCGLACMYANYLGGQRFKEYKDFQEVENDR